MGAMKNAMPERTRQASPLAFRSQYAAASIRSKVEFMVVRDKRTKEEK